MGRPVYLAAAITVAAAIIVLTAATEQDDQQDDPAQVATATVVATKVTHKRYLQEFDVVHRHSCP